MHRLNTAIRGSRIWRAARSRISTSPSAYFFLARLLRNKGLLEANTELVIDGFPRCANSFAEAAFRYSQDRPVRLAHHTHAAAQIVRAVQLGIPTLVVFRNPDEAVASLSDMMPRTTPVAWLFDDYATFYETVLAARDGVVFGRFEDVVSEFDQLIARLNDRFGTDFRHFPFGKSDTTEIDRLMDALSLERARRVSNYSQAHAETVLEKRSARKADLLARVMAPEATLSRARAQKTFASVSAAAMADKPAPKEASRNVA